MNNKQLGIVYAKLASMNSVHPNHRVGAAVFCGVSDNFILGYNIKQNISDKTTHAEELALSRLPENFTPDVIFITHPPCFDCAKLIVNTKITKVITKKRTLSSDWQEKWSASCDAARKLLSDNFIILEEIS